ncbi:MULTISPECIES: hypothetical protein [Methylorubrum]|uniref:hypothetical protein n=1 Tax=Methylorubrum TaxID=2282523 RepID=UPI0020A0DDBD|nr:MULTISPECIES: hypothetical protein [Methylorubrum]MCP1550713.1 hypothetical protein [Methylorubrum zatmanii]MCP1552674.1 hypothetical protein [Methylorubrum extorquens]MCP1581016.1 hypothetical protein [Methylorubrum extorquens]
MAGFTPSNGSKLFIGPVINIDEIDDATDLSGLTGFTEVKGLKDLAAFGDESAAITSNQLGANRTLKAKGTRDAGTPGFVVDRKEGDPGQDAALAAEAQPFDYAFYVELPNKKTTGGTNGKRYFAGQVMSCRESVGAANNPVTMTISVGINTPIFRVAAT